MKNSKILNAIGVIALTIVTLFVVGGFKHAGETSVGGTFNPVTVDFAQGITVNGTSVIDSSGGVSATTLTATGAVSLGSATAGVNTFRPTYAPAADVTLTVARTGSMVKMNTAGEDITLPAVASSNGVHFRFAVTAVVASTNMTINSAEGDNIEGSLIIAGAVADCSANDVLTIDISKEDIGDFVDLYSDGTSWLIGSSNILTASGWTCTG